jgi:hypothetical protein
MRPFRRRNGGGAAPLRRRLRWALATGGLVGVGLLAALLTLALAASLRSTPAKASATQVETAAAVNQAKRVALQFFRAIDTRHFDRACDLLSARFYQLNAIPSHRMCVLSLTYGMSTAGVRYRVLRARGDRSRAEVTVLADGVRGRLQLVREGRSFKIVSLGAA